MFGTRLLTQGVHVGKSCARARPCLFPRTQAVGLRSANASLHTRSLCAGPALPQWWCLVPAALASGSALALCTLANSIGSSGTAECDGDEPQQQQVDTSLHSEDSVRARELADILQACFMATLDTVTASTGYQTPIPWDGVEWVRDGGLHGGGVRYQKIDNPLFHRVTVNVSAVHYEDKVLALRESAAAHTDTHMQAGRERERERESEREREREACPCNHACRCACGCVRGFDTGGSV